MISMEPFNFIHDMKHYLESDNMIAGLHNTQQICPLSFYYRLFRILTGPWNRFCAKNILPWKQKTRWAQTTDTETQDSVTEAVYRFSSQNHHYCRWQHHTEFWHYGLDSRKTMRGVKGAGSIFYSSVRGKFEKNKNDHHQNISWKEKVP